MTTATTEALIVNATAGSGKTTTVVDGINFCVTKELPSRYVASDEQVAIWEWMEERITKDSEVVFLAFNKAIADELSERLTFGTASTIHSLGYRILRSAGVKCNKPTTWKTANLYCQYMQIDSLRELDKDGQDIFDDVKEVVKMCKDQLLTEETIDSDSLKMTCMNRGFVPATDFDVLVSAAKYIIETGSKLKTGIMSKPIDIDFDDMIYLPARYGFKTQFDVMIVDEAQDLSHGKLQLILNQDCNTYVFVGDPCQPTGTKVRKLLYRGTTSNTPIMVDTNIEDIKVGDYVVGYDPRSTAFIQNGREVLGITKKKYKGELVVINTTDGKLKSKYTLSHHCYTSFEPLRDKFVVYLMEKNKQFRIGKAKVSYGSSASGPIATARVEKADRLWLLSFQNTDTEALAIEGAIAGRFGLPELCFQDCNNNEYNQELLDNAWEFIGENTSRGLECLEFFGRKFIYPLWEATVNDTYFSLKRPMVVRACNLVDGVKVLPHYGRLRATGKQWKTITIAREVYEGDVYSLSVDKEQLYVADSIVTHNCQAIYGFAGADTQSFASIAEAITDHTVLPLSYTYRCGKAIVLEAQKIVGNAINYGTTNPEGLVKTVEQEDMDLTEGDMLVSRVNAPLMGIAWQLVKVRRNVKVVGRDIGKGLVKLIKRLAGKGKNNTTSVMDLATRVESWRAKEIELLQNKKSDTDGQQIAIGDQADCIITLAGECETIPAMIEFIDGLFDDSDLKKCIRLSSIHRSKGLEASRVFFFNPANVPHKMAKTEEAILQEYNLKFVATTRAINELIYVTPTDRKKGNK